MPIIFSIVARGSTVLAKHASCVGNFTEIVDQVLPKISPENAKMTFTHGSYLFHYISENRVIFFCITDDDFERSKAFAYLTEIKRRFQALYGDRAQTALPYAMNSEFSLVLAAQMKHFSSPTQDPDRLTQVQGQVDELKGIMVRNIDSLASRGERLELLVDKTEDLQAGSVTFRTRSRHLERSMWWKNVKLCVIIVIVVIILLYFIVSLSCGGLTWPNCVNKK